MIAYKVVDQQYRTRAGESNEITWRIGERHNAVAEGAKLCTDQVIHSYVSPALAAFLNPIHAGIQAPLCIEIETGPVVASDGLKRGHKWARMLHDVPLPAPTHRQCVIFAILCVRAIPGRASIPKWETWADAYLRGDAADAAYAASRVASRAASRAAYAAADAADAVYAAARVAADAIDFATLAKQALTYT